MSSYLQAFKLCLRHRLTLAAALLCSLLVGVLWGSNIGAVVPLVRVLFKGEPVLVSLDADIAACEEKLAQLDREIESLQAQGTASDETQLTRLRDRRQAEELALAARQRLRPIAAAWLPNDTYQCLLAVVGFLIFMALLRTTFLMANLLLVERVVRGSLMEVRNRFFARVLDMDLSQLGASSTGDLTSRFTYDVDTLAVSLRTLFCRATVEPLKMLACLIGAGIVCWRLLLFSLIMAPLAGFLIRKLSASIKRSNRRGMESMGQLVSRLSESLESVQTVQAFTMEDHEERRFTERARGFYRKALRIAFYGSLTKPCMELFGIGVMCAALLGGGYLVLEQQTHLLGIKITDRPLSPEMMIAFFAMLVGMSDPGRKLASIYNLVQPGVPAAERIFQMLDCPAKITDPPSPQHVARPHQVLSFENIVFRYGDGEAVLRGIDLEIPHGQSLAIVGPNGCGKTTLTSLVPRFYDPSEGAVKLDGTDLREMSLADLRGRMALVSQQALLFDDTITANIRYGSLDASDEEVRRAAEKADAHEFITNALEEGYQTRVGPRGENLSGGQRQKIALARAILRDADILILDEATSQVDIESEHQVHEVLKQFIAGRTAIMITHRLSTLSLADRILVMDAGRILDIGTHDELLTRCDVYRRLHEGELKKSA